MLTSGSASEQRGPTHDQGVFENISIPQNPRKRLNILPSRYVLAHKNVGTSEQYAKARLVVQAMRRIDRDFAKLCTYSPTVAKASARSLLTISASTDLNVTTRDLTQAYVCTTHAFLRAVCVTSPADAKAPPDELWLLNRPLYGLAESGAMWYATFAR